ncbi:autoinducer binding domain-containing protein [Rhizomicrobium electricum]|nr:DNA-binding CsgD family transcriptional regulator [Rhizomicrobium electricum]
MARKKSSTPAKVPAGITRTVTAVARHAAPSAMGLAAFEYIDRLQRLDEPQAVRAAFADAITALGVTSFALLEVNPNPEAFQRTVIDDTMPVGWKERYFEQKYAAIDPCVRAIASSVEPFLWSEALARSRREKPQRRIYDEAGSFGLNQGLCVPIYGPNRYMAFATLAGPQLDLAPTSRAALHVMALYTHNRLLTLMQTETTEAPTLTRRERECLTWVAQGKSDWEIGEILKISERTAHWYIECAKRKFGVATRIQAVVNAAAAGLIGV